MPRCCACCAAADAFPSWRQVRCSRGCAALPCARCAASRSTGPRARRRLRAGRCVAIFPEGALNPTETLLPFKQGAALLALQAGVPVIPVYSAGNYQPFQRLQLRFGAPIVLTQRPNAAGVQEADMERLQEELYLEMKPKYRTRAAEFHRRFRETTLRRQREQQEGEKNHDA